MKRFFVFALIAFFAAGFLGANMAEAQLVNIYNMSYVYSPDSDTTSSTGTTTDDVYLNQWGSLHLGQPSSTSDAASATLYTSSEDPAGGIFGVGAPLPYASGYNIYFDYHLRTWDSSSYDNFIVVVTQGDYYWNGGTEIGSWSWGGTTEGVQENNDYPTADLHASIGVMPNTNYYLNVVMDVDETLYASWGRFSDIAVESTPVPEPASMILLGIGLVGIVAVRRKME